MLGKQIGLGQRKGCRGAGAEKCGENLGLGAATTITRDRCVKSEQTFLQESNMLFQR